MKIRVYFRLISFQFLVILAFSCKDANQEEDVLKTYNLKILPKVSTVSLSDLGLRTIEYIPLETTDSGLIERKYSPLSTYKILSGEDFFIIRYNSSLLKFKDDGSFIGKVGTIGRGPKEFLICHDIEVDESGRVYIVDAWKEMFFKYSENGNLIKTFRSPLIQEQVEFIYFDGKFLCYNPNPQANIINSFNVVDSTGTILKSFPNKYPFTRNGGFWFNHENIFYRFKHKIFKKEIYCDTIFEFDDLSFKPHIVIQIGDKLVTPEIRSKIDGLEIASKYISPFKLFEFGDFIYYEFASKLTVFSDSEIYGFIASKKNDFEALIVPEEGLINDIDGGPNITPITTKDDNTIIAMIESMELKKFLASDTFKNSNPKYPDRKEKLQKLANTLKETDNPLLILVSF